MTEQILPTHMASVCLSDGSKLPPRVSGQEISLKADCAFLLPQSFICNFLIYTVPWINYYELWNNSCLEARL